MRVKKYLALILAVIAACSLFLTPVCAYENTSEIVTISSQRIDLADGSYVIEEIVEINTNQLTRATSTKTGYKNSTYYTSDNVAVFTVRVTGSFEYTGSTSKATSSAATVYIHHSSASYLSKSSSYSGNTAYATGKVTFYSETASRSVALSCSATGVLS